MEKILVIDFGSQYTQLIARRLRENGVFSEIVSCHHIPASDPLVKGIILAGSPYSVRERDAPKPDLRSIFTAGPVLGICYGAQLIAQAGGGSVAPSHKREYGKATLSLRNADPLFVGLPEDSQVWMSHSDTVAAIPPHTVILAHTESIEIAAYRIDHKPFPVYGLQFHPEVTHTIYGKQILENFIFGICKCQGNWNAASFLAEKVNEIRRMVGTDKVLLGLSGGVDSSVAASLIHKAIGNQMVCFFIDNGLLRKNENEEVMASYHKLGFNITGIDAQKEFYHALAGVTDPEQKRKIIGRQFIEVFEQEAYKLNDVKWLGQGTIYPDVIESVSVHGPSVTIKSHHNVGGLPDKMKLKVLEPLNRLFKDEVRLVGKEAGLPDSILDRHPFPGPGLAVRILGEINPQRVKMLQEADHIFIYSLKKHGLYDKVWQAGAILLPIHSVGVMGEDRTYEQVIALRAVNSTDGMTAEWCKLPYEFLASVSNEIINQVKGINRVVYDISSKPPTTIEWE